MPRAASTPASPSARSASAPYVTTRPPSVTATAAGSRRACARKRLATLLRPPRATSSSTLGTTPDGAGDNAPEPTPEALSRVPRPPPRVPRPHLDRLDAVPKGVVESGVARYELRFGDGVAFMAARRGGSIEAIVTDPPYGVREYEPAE